MEEEAKKLEENIEGFFSNIYSLYESKAKEEIKEHVTEEFRVVSFNKNNLNNWEKEYNYGYYGYDADDYSDVYMNSKRHLEQLEKQFNESIPTVQIYLKTEKKEIVFIDELIPDSDIIFYVENQFKPDDSREFLEYQDEFYFYQDVDWNNLYDAIQDYYCVCMAG